MSGDLQNKNDKQLVPVMQKPARKSTAVVPYKSVRSEAEVKHGIVHFAAPFSPLSIHTDLNIPPSNWLRASSELEQHVRDLTWNTARTPSQFSSIDMAHNFPDLAGEVDVITHAANIKKLLKMPFEKSHVSMMVHRVGKTLLLDEFDIHKHLLRTEQNEWGWLRRFYYESVLRDIEENMKCVPRPSKSRDDLQSRNMYSKFLYHSLGENETGVEAADLREMLNTDNQSLIPDPLPKPRESQTHRDVLWTFEDIRMLIGTDLPVFRDESYYVSLRLRDMRTPINVLTGLDYWLDNLMCNVPEVAMCFHIEGIVQQYEIIKTEDIPHLENSKFDQGTVTNIAKNILSFLKNNATKEGHTYWLYKGNNDDVVKLYDLTALCGEVNSEPERNPFTVPLGMLLYRVARSMWTNRTPGREPLTRTLLENCLVLLDETKHAQVCTSATYLLSDLYVPDSSLEDNWSLPGNSSNETSDEEQDSEEFSESDTSSIRVQTLSDNGSVTRSGDLLRLKPFQETSEQRCCEAVKFICKGLKCLQFDLEHGAHRPSKIIEEQVRCNRDEAIPLHYEPLNKPSSQEQRQSQSEEKRSLADLRVTSKSPEVEGQGHAWHLVSKGLLYRKAAYTFLALAKPCVPRGEMLETLRYLRLAFACFGMLKSLLPNKVKENDALLSSMYGLLGDCRLGYLKSRLPPVDWGTVWNAGMPEEGTLMELIEKEGEHFEFEDLFNSSCKDDIILESCVQCYTEALALTSKKNASVYTALQKRRGNALNELGVCLMLMAQKHLEGSDLSDSGLQHMEDLWHRSLSVFNDGIAVFEDAKDVANQALLNCNAGRLMRLVAQTHTKVALKGNLHEFTPLEREYYNKAIDRYKTALKLGTQGFKHIVESVKWELSTTYFNMAALLQDYAPLSSRKQEEVENEVVNLMFQSLHFCNKGAESFATQTMYQFRAATINHRLASLFHNTLRQECKEHKRKHLHTLSERHYVQALNLYQQMDCHLEYLQTKLEFVALLELAGAGASSARNQLRCQLQIVHSLSECSESLSSLANLLKESEKTSNVWKEGLTITKIIEDKIQSGLLHLVKLYKQLHVKKSSTQELPMKAERLKRFYAASLTNRTLAKVIDQLCEVTFSENLTFKRQ
ncbi:hypothetical protein DPMN_065948 [Dreissena polymorpha]|uniref:Erythroid differentiation-related factor 1 n=1 Tax=Dreissena polymorpha TaxID=45954 RepID=A0A9D4BK23_DREPO|nr:hypothetical protein DPMN_065948 [Dreissena polymorpha]